MIPLDLNTNNPAGLNILCLGAHCDDIEIGCGGALLKLISEKKVKSIKWVVFASTPLRKKEAIASAELFLKDVVEKDIVVLDHKDAFLQFSAMEIKKYFEFIKKFFEPDLVFTHYRDDRHQDHRLLSDLTWNTFRNHMILEYEIPKYDGDLGIPNCFFRLTKGLAQQKAAILMDSFKSQKGKHWFDEETFLSLMRIRGLESASPNRYAEAFHCRKFIF